jgi:arylsulfatase A-like enzyme
MGRFLLAVAIGLWSWAADAARPSFVVVMTDDMPVSMGSAMPLTRQLVGARGITFRQAFVEDPLCCPSRATFLTGRYAHNHGVHTNSQSVPDGGWKAFRAAGNESRTLAVWLQAAGYRTALIGKYLNGYSGADATHIPEGWTRWFAETSNLRGGFNWGASDQGVRRWHGTAPTHYATDVLLTRSQSFIDAAVAAGRPFFLFLSVAAPHHPWVAAPRHSAVPLTGRVPRTPDFNEAVVSDKPGFLRLPRLSSTAIALLDDHYARALRSLRAVDEAVQSLIAKLDSVGRLGDTFVIFTSDNGYHFGQHRLPEGKQVPYDTDLRVPLAIRGPGIPPGRVNDSAMVLNVDLAPTILELAGIAVPAVVDGGSFKDLLIASVPSRPRRHAFPIAGWADPITPMPWDIEYRGVRTARYTWVEWSNGARELYDTMADPYQLQNRANAAALATVRAQLAALTARLRTCAGQTCRDVEAAPAP